MTKFGRVGVVDPSHPSFVADRASGAVVLGPFASRKKAKAARKPVGAILSKLDLVADAEVMLVPRDTFPAEAPTAPTTIPIAPPSTRPVTTEKKSTGTDERQRRLLGAPFDTGDLGGALRLQLQAALGSLERCVSGGDGSQRPTGVGGPGFGEQRVRQDRSSRRPLCLGGERQPRLNAAMRTDRHVRSVERRSSALLLVLGW